MEIELSNVDLIDLDATDFTVTASVAPTDDFLSDTSTTGVVSAGGSVTGEVEIVGDQDWFAVSLTGGETYQIDLEGSPTGMGSLSDPCWVCTMLAAILLGPMTMAARD